MSIQISSPLSAQSRGDARFSVRSFNLYSPADEQSPLLMLDEFRVRGHRFPAHPHAGFSAVTYVFEDSASSLRVLDSTGNDIQIGAGGIVWTQAGSGILHQELPVSGEHELHGIQFFVNLRSTNKQLAPQTWWLDGNAMPVWRNTKGDSVRVAVGQYQKLASPLRPAEPFTMLDMDVHSELDVHVPSDHHGFVYVQSGRIGLHNGADAVSLLAGQGAHLVGAGHIRIATDSRARAVFLCGQTIHETVVMLGPFVMNSQQQIETAIQRYHSGRMGQMPSFRPEYGI